MTIPQDDMAHLRLEILGFDLVRAVHATRDRATVGARRDETWELPRFTHLVAKIDFVPQEQVTGLLREAGRALLEAATEDPDLVALLPSRLATSVAKYLHAARSASESAASHPATERGMPTVD